MRLDARVGRQTRFTNIRLADLLPNSCGSTMIGAGQTGRHGFLMELDPLYCDVIVQRFEEFTGKNAECPPRNPPKRVLRMLNERVSLPLLANNASVLIDDRV